MSVGRNIGRARWLRSENIRDSTTSVSFEIMKTRLVKILLFAILGSQSASAEVNEVLLANWASFTLDVDGDEMADFKGSTSNTENITLINVAEGNAFTVQNLPGTRPGQGTLGSSFNFATIAAIQADAIYAGSVSINTPQIINTLHLAENSSVVFNANETTPILAGWRFGTSGTGNDPLTIIGFILDTTEFFSSGGAAPIKLYTHLYGVLGPGDPALSVSLATALGVGGGSAAVGGVLPTTSSFTGPKSGSITTPSVIGKTYRLHRLANLGASATVVDTRSGTGSEIVFTFDDSDRNVSQAFYYVTEM